MVSATERSSPRRRSLARKTTPLTAEQKTHVPSETKPRVLAIVVTHNGDAWLEPCLGALSRQIYSNLDVVVVDSGSAPAVTGGFGSLLPEAELVRVERNVGFGASANVALEVSSKAPSADYFLFLHDDVELEPEAVSLLVAGALETGAGIIGGKGVEWDHPERLLEVGMSADQFGYPYSNLEPGEIDQGQHDAQRETLFVTSACIMVSREFIENCGLWDGGYFAFSEDLDLCTRARLSGFKVIVQPGARFRHAVALANGQRPVKAMPSVRFLTRRNRLRTIAKNASLLRMVFTIFLYLPLTAAEIVLLVFFRRFEEIAEYPKAFASFLLSTPDIVRRRRAVQKRRKVPDRRIRPFMVSDTSRARVFFENRLRAWEKGTLALGARTLSHLAPSAIKATVSSWIRRPATLATAGILVLLAFAMRASLLGEPIAGATLWPFPEGTGRFLTEYFSGWRDVNLGSESAAPPAFVVMWLAGLAAFGKAVLAQKLLVASLVAAGLIGIFRFVSNRTSSSLAKVLAVGIYALAPVMQLIISTGDLAALALYAGLPYLLHIALRIVGTVPQHPTYTTDTMTRDIARFALISAGVVSLAPSAFIALAILSALLCLAMVGLKQELDETSRRMSSLMLGVAVAVLLLVPWTLEAMRPNGPMLAPLFSGRGGSFFPLWSRHDFRQMFFLNLYGGLGALTTLAVAIGVLVLASPRRRREARVLMTIWLGFALIGGMAAKGLISPPVASPAIWLTVPLAILAALAGHLVAGAKEELPKHAFGWRHRIAMPTVSVVLAAGILLAWVPSLPSWGRPAPAFASGVGDQAASIASLLQTTADQVGDFRVLWLGERWIDPIRAGSRRFDGGPFFLTGSRGLSMLDAHNPPPAEGEKKLEETVQGLLGQRLHLAGHLLAPANVRFIVVDPRDEVSMTALGLQRDITLEQQQPNIAIFRNLQWLPRAVLAPVNLVEPVTAKANDDRALMLVKWSGGRSIPRSGTTSFRGELPRTRHSQLLLAENFNKSWRARVDGQRLTQEMAFGWANRFELPSSATGEVRIDYRGLPSRLLWLAFESLLLFLAFAVGKGERGEIAGRLR